jgi:hypothetical protein
MFCPKFSLFQLYRWVKGEGTSFVHRNFNFGEPSKVSAFSSDGPIKNGQLQPTPKNKNKI